MLHAGWLAVRSAFNDGLCVPCRWWTPILWRSTLHEASLVVQDQMHPLQRILVTLLPISRVKPAPV